MILIDANLLQSSVLSGQFSVQISTTPPFGHPSLTKEGSCAVAQALLPVPKPSTWRTGKSACATDH